MLKKYVFKSDKPGLSVLFLGAVHGNEPGGTNAVFKVVEKFAAGALKPLKGCVSFIPVCNPEAFFRNVRQIDENLNRVIRRWDNPQTYEQTLACEIADEIAGADVIIDLHSTHCPEDKPFIFSDYPDPLADRLAAAQNIEWIVKGWPQIYAADNRIEDFSTGSWAHRCGKTCLTVECGYHFAEEAVQNAYYVIMNTLLCLKMLEGISSAPICQKQVVMDSFVIKTQPGRLMRKFKHFDTAAQNEILAVYNDGTPVICPRDSLVMLPNPEAAVNTEWFYLGHIA